MIIEKKQPAKTVKRDYGDTVTPQTAEMMLYGLTDEIVILHDCILALTSDFGRIVIHAKLFKAGNCNRRTSRYELIDVLNLRDCLYVVNKPQRNTTIHKIQSNDPISACITLIEPSKQTVDSFAEAIKSAMPTIPCVFECAGGGILIQSNQQEANDTTNTEVA